MATMKVEDSFSGADVDVELPPAPGRAAAAASRPVALSTEDLAALTALATRLGEVQASPTADTVLDRLKAIEAALIAATGEQAIPYKNLDVDESEDQVKATAGSIYFIHAMNLSAAKLYLKFYNNTAAGVTVGTTVPDFTFTVATLGDTNGDGFILALSNGISFTTAITIAATTGFADNDTGAPGANELIVNLGYA